MIGIYKITNPKGRVYIGQSIDIERRAFRYSVEGSCKGQPRLYASLLKYGFSNHIFEIIEQCKVEDLNTRERYWQDFYNVLSEQGMNCRLTGAQGNSGYLSEQVRSNQSISKKAFYKTKEGREAVACRLANIDYVARTRNTDYVARTRNTDYKTRSTNPAYITRERWEGKLINQYTKEGVFVKEWKSIKQAGEALKIQRTSITQCCKGKLKTAGGFIWKYG